MVSWLIGQLLGRLGVTVTPTCQDILQALQPGHACTAQGRLIRLPMSVKGAQGVVPLYQLAFKLGNLVSIKGEDVLISAPSSQMARFHRLRASVPSKLWKWSIVAGWTWKLSKEHINSLELRAILTSLRWRIERKFHTNACFLHLTDSLVCLHCLTRAALANSVALSLASMLWYLLQTLNPSGGMCIQIRIPPTSPVVGAGGSEPNLGTMPRERILEGLRQEDRAIQRQRLGTLRELIQYNQQLESVIPMQLTSFSNFFKWKARHCLMTSVSLILSCVTTWSTCGLLARAEDRHATLWRGYRICNQIFVATFRVRGDF